MKYNRAWLETEYRRKAKLRFLFFWGRRPSNDGMLSPSCFSQWWPAPFLVDGRKYPTAEHWMMRQKALLFDDLASADRILAASSPKQAKELGRKVLGFNNDLWNKEKYRIVLAGSIAKFGQNPSLKDFLLNTGNRILVEASPVDRIWGIGMAADDPGVENPLLWRGENLLGFALMEARDELGGKTS
ncbi:NADAR family protein [Mesorhizobium sp. LHD-90]|uniref:NADAR family protein n=1 Tax=Mesorhizobium sp. LHD-90 TaxID=3071414 RepID=UPI0027DF176D|nr:NADAR family protein [Mesorhizobium sp. LHD-90]MDQ6437639.1 NADAR family protein [Mesorhizobium sp. LHD-90]